MNCSKIIFYAADGSEQRVLEIGNHYNGDKRTIIDSIYCETYDHQGGSKIILWVGEFSVFVDETGSKNYIRLGSRIVNNFLEMKQYELFYSGTIYAKLITNKK